MSDVFPKWPLSFYIATHRLWDLNFTIKFKLWPDHYIVFGLPLTHRVLLNFKDSNSDILSKLNKTDLLTEISNILNENHCNGNPKV